MIRIVCIGKLKEQGFKDIEKEFLKRISVFDQVKIHELKEEKFDRKSQRNVILEKEANKIIPQIHENTYIICLERNGIQLSSQEFSEKLQLTRQTHKEILFLIGGPLGLHESIVKKSHFALSFSRMTFTHQFARIFLQEQIYRAYMIQNNKPYHY